MSNPSTGTHGPATRRVLFVDDDTAFLDTVRELMGILSEGQWDIFTAESASQAFALMQKHLVDLAVIDVQMGVMDGIQMLSMLNRGYPNVQKVVLTGHANEKYRAACLSNGAELYLLKPTNPSGWQSLHGVLNELVKLRPEEGFRGVLRKVGLQDVIQMECLARSSSVLEISNASVTGRVFIDTGQIIHAQCGGLEGEEAFNRLMSLGGGQFNLKPFTEPATRSLSGQWEFLLMEAARKADEERESRPPDSSDTKTTVRKALVEEAERILSAAGSGEVTPGTPAALTPGDPSRPKVDEVLVCSAEGDVLYNWQCAHPDLWVNFFEFVSQRGRRLTQALPLGGFNRLEIQSGTARAVVIISDERGVLVKTRREAPAS
jgi:CheY-like chemotaxis protein